MERNIRLLDLLQQGSSRVGGGGDHGDGDLGDGDHGDGDHGGDDHGDGDHGDHGDGDHGHGHGECVGFALYFIGTLLISNKLKFQI